MDASVVLQYLADAASAPNSDAKGKAYEALLCYLFTCVPGCIAETDVTNVFGTEQIDIAIGNSKAQDGLSLLPQVFLVECKDWDVPVDSKTVGYFFNILAGRGVEVGVLVAANGITGTAQELRHAHAIGLHGAPRGIKVIVITTQEIQSICTVAEFVELIQRRLLRAYASGGIGAPL